MARRSWIGSLEERTLLGECLATFHPHPIQNCVDVLVLALALAFGGITLASLADGSTVGAAGPVVRETSTKWVLLLGGGLVVWGAVLGGRVISRSRRSIRVHSGGLARMQGRRPEVVLWRDVEQVRWLPGSPRDHTGAGSTLLVTRADGRTVFFNGAQVRVRKLRSLVEGLTLAPLLNKAMQTYREGETLLWGPLRLSPRGIELGTTLFPWAGQPSVTLDDWALTLIPEAGVSRSTVLPLSEVANAHVLPALLAAVQADALAATPSTGDGCPPFPEVR